MKKEILNITLIGPQGSGKGTQAKLLAKKFRLAHIEIGRILREIAKTKTPLGRKVDDLINKQGRMVPFDLIMRVVKERIKTAKPNQGIVFDGTPRRLAEIQPLEKILAYYGRRLTHVFYLAIPEKETMRRLSKRRMCKKCGQLFIAGVDIFAKRKKCPKCGGEIIQREDDKPKAIRQRLKLYRQKTEPVVKYYRCQKKLIKIAGEQSIKKVFQDIVSRLK